MFSEPAAPVTRIVQLVLSSPARAGRTRVLALDGRSGSGKTTLAGQVANALDTLGAGRTQILHLDDVYPGWEGLLASVPLVVDEVLKPLSEGRPAGHRRWSWPRNTWTESSRVLPEADVLIIEGIGSGARPCVPYLSALVWLEADEAVRYERAMARDGETYRPNWARWAVQEEEYLRIHDPMARAALRIYSQVHGVG